MYLNILWPDHAPHFFMLTKKRMQVIGLSEVEKVM